MDRNIGAPNRRIPPDVQPKGSTARDLERTREPSEQIAQQTPEENSEPTDFD
jgi:hypothetical protein